MLETLWKQQLEDVGGEIFMILTFHLMLGEAFHVIFVSNIFVAKGNLSAAKSLL